MIFESHREFLLSRDLTTLGFLFLVLFSIGALFLINYSKYKYLYILYLFFQYIILAIYSRNKGNRFVCNVIAIEACADKSSSVFNVNYTEKG